MSCDQCWKHIRKDRCPECGASFLEVADVGDWVRIRSSAFCRGRSTRIAEIGKFHSGMTKYIMEDGGHFGRDEFKVVTKAVGK